MTSTANNQGFWGLAIPRFIAVVIHKRELKAEGRAETVEKDLASDHLPALRFEPSG